MVNRKHPRATMRVHANKLTTVVVPLVGAMTATTMVLVRTGRVHEDTAQAGISHFLEHMIFKGTEQDTTKDLLRFFDDRGAYINAFTTHEFTGYYTKVANPLREEVSVKLSEAVLGAAFPENEITREKNVVCAEIDMYEDSPQSNAYAQFRHGMYRGHMLGESILGTKKSVRDLDKNMLDAYHASRYTAGNMVVLCAGDVPAGKTHKFLAGLFADVPVGKKIRTEKHVRAKTKRSQVLVRKKKTDQVHLMMGFPTVPIEHKDSVVCGFISHLLTGGMSARLTYRIREEMGSGYYIYTDQNGHGPSGHFAIGTGTEVGRVREVVHVIAEELERLKTEMCTPRELKILKRSLAAKMVMRLETAEQYADFYGWQTMYPKQIQKLLTPKEKIRRMREISPADIQRVARKYFTHETLLISIVGEGVETRGLLKDIPLS